jgi:hypothetical protein
METPPEGTSELEMLLLLSQAFLDRAPEADASKEGQGTFMFSKLDEVPASSYAAFIKRSSSLAARDTPRVRVPSARETRSAPAVAIQSDWHAARKQKFLYPG